MLSEETRLRLATDATHQSLGPGEDTVILSLSSGHLYTCNETTASMLKALAKEQTLGQLIDHLQEEFDVPRETLARDLTELTEKLIAEKLVEPA
jgi:transcriptional antiterminator